MKIKPLFCRAPLLNAKSSNALMTGWESLQIEKIDQLRDICAQWAVDL